MKIPDENFGLIRSKSVLRVSESHPAQGQQVKVPIRIGRVSKETMTIWLSVPEKAIFVCCTKRMDRVPILSFKHRAFSSANLTVGYADDPAAQNHRFVADHLNEFAVINIATISVTEADTKNVGVSLQHGLTDTCASPNTPPCSDRFDSTTKTLLGARRTERLMNSAACSARRSGNSEQNIKPDGDKKWRCLNGIGAKIYHQWQNVKRFSTALALAAQ
jgi:hypothetical protein